MNTAGQILPDQSPLSDTLHQSCSTLPLHNFWEILIDGDLRWLIINGNPSEDQMRNAWEGIGEEYMGLINNPKAQSIFLLSKKIEQAEWQKEFIEKSIKALKFQYDSDIADWVSELGYGIVEYSTNRETYLKSLISIELSAKTLIVLLNQYRAEYEFYKEKAGETVSNQSPAERRFSYAKEIALLSRFQGQRLIKEKITVLEYCAIINNYLEENKKPEGTNG